MKVFGFILCFVLFLASLWLMALAFRIPGFEALLFAGGILGVTVAFLIPFNLIKTGS